VDVFSPARHPLLTPPPATREVLLDADGDTLVGTLSIPDRAVGLVIFAHGSGSNRQSPRNRVVADQLHAAGLATLLLDLLTATEDARDRLTAELRFDIALLTRRLEAAVRWATREPDTASLPIGLFGASTGGAAALAAAAERREVRAIVIRGGRPDLAGPLLPAVRAATLMIVGGNDELVLRLNRAACAMMKQAECRVVVVPGASHLFEEPGALEEVSRLAVDWFVQHLAPDNPR
jgi:dienelactone hydrolase